MARQWWKPVAVAILLAKVERQLELKNWRPSGQYSKMPLKRKVGWRCSSVVEPLPYVWGPGFSPCTAKKTLYHYKNNVSLQTSRQCSFSLPSAGSLLEFLKTEEGSKQPLPKLIDFSAQVSLGQLRSGEVMSLGCSMSFVWIPSPLYMYMDGFQDPTDTKSLCMLKSFIKKSTIYK